MAFPWPASKPEATLQRHWNYKPLPGHRLTRQRSRWSRFRSFVEVSRLRELSKLSEASLTVSILFCKDMGNNLYDTCYTLHVKLLKIDVILCWNSCRHPTFLPVLWPRFSVHAHLHLAHPHACHQSCLFHLHIPCSAMQVTRLKTIKLFLFSTVGWETVHANKVTWIF